MTEFYEYKGEELPFKMSYSIIKRICAKFNYKISEFPNALDDADQLEYVVFYGFQKGHDLENKPFKIKFEQIEDILSETSISVPLNRAIKRECFKFYDMEGQYEMMEGAKKKMKAIQAKNSI